METQNFTPSYSSKIEGWTKNYLKSNFWRISRIYQYDDIMQDSYVLFMELKNRYGGTVDNARWFMSLYQRSFINMFTDLSNVNTNEEHTTPISHLGKSYTEEDDDDLFFDTQLGTEENEGYLEIMLKQAPDEIKTVLNIILNSPTEMRENLIQAWKAHGKKKDFGNEHLCLMAGLDPKKVDIVQSISTYFHLF